MSKPFFLTRQTADLMEDLVRDLSAATGLYLIYGDSGVGKTRLLQELVQTRLTDSKIHWIDLQAGSSDDGALVDSSVLIEETFARARPGDIIVADHFEMAMKKTRHQLFLCWSIDGLDKQINLIVASNTKYFNDLRQLAQQYQVRIKSFQQMPFTPDEAPAFLAFYLFPDRPGIKLTAPPLLRNQLDMAQGCAGKIVEIADRAGNQMTSETVTETAPKSRSSRIIATVLIVVAVIGGAAWYLIDGHPGTDWSTFAKSGSAEIKQVTSVQPVASEPVTDKAIDSSTDDIVRMTAETATTGVDNAAVTAESEVDNTDPAMVDVDSPMESVSTGVDQNAAEVVAVAVPESGVQTATKTETKIVIVASTTSVDQYSGAQPSVIDSSKPDEPEPGQDGSNVVAVIPAEAGAEKVLSGSVASSSRLTGSGSDRLQQDMQASLEWINGRAGNVGTLQIMLLSQERFDENTYYGYVDRLARQGVDISQIRILPTLTGGKKLFNVVYGEYKNRDAASAGKSDLPVVLQKASPIPRSVGALKEEMRRLEGQN